MLDQETQESSLLDESPESEEDKDPFEYVNGVLVLKAGSLDLASVEAAIQSDRENRMLLILNGDASQAYTFLLENKKS
jgi:hypothetical protein